MGDVWVNCKINGKSFPNVSENNAFLVKKIWEKKKLEISSKVIKFKRKNRFINNVHTFIFFCPHKLICVN